jgi:ribonuclease P protein component
MLTITTLKTRADFLRLRRGAKVVTPYFILRYMPTPGETATSAVRVGYTVTTKCGNAVTRNRIKRRLRALVRELFPEQAKGAQDYVLIALESAKVSPADAPIDALREAMQTALARVK